MMSELADGGGRWCILRTSGPSTLKLAESLIAVGVDAWTPAVTAGRLVRRGATMVKAERTSPILPTFVFARSVDLPTLADIVADPWHRHPAFSLFRYQGRYPLVGEASIAGLRAAEQEAAEALQRERDAADREARRVERIANLRTEQARRKALRRVRREFLDGARVEVAEMTPLAGLTGVVQSSEGRTAIVDFGGALVMKIEAWRLSPRDVIDLEA